MPPVDTRVVQDRPTRRAGPTRAPVAGANPWPILQSAANWELAMSWSLTRAHGAVSAGVRRPASGSAHGERTDHTQHPAVAAEVAANSWPTPSLRRSTTF